MSETPQMPSDLCESGRRLWSSVLDEFDPAEYEVALLIQAARTLDALDALQSELIADGPIIDSPQGRKAHPALAELRQQRVVLARLLAALGLRDGEQDSTARAPRGVYQPQAARS